MLIVKFGFASLEDRDAVMKHFGQAAAHVLEHEPDVLSYRIVTLNSDPTKIAIFERCENCTAAMRAYCQIFRYVSDTAPPSAQLICSDTLSAVPGVHKESDSF